jgi:hypothetical protein
MTTPMERGVFLQPASEEVPVWQPEMLHAEPLNAMDDAALDDAAPGEPAADAAPPSDLPTGRLDRARRAGSVSALLVISAMVALGGVTFAVGRATSPGGSGTGLTNNGAIGQNGVPAFGANASGALNFARGGPDDGVRLGAATVTGTVMSVTSTSMTIQEPNGRTVTVATGSSTTYHSQTSATSSDVTTGATVVVQTSGTGVVPNSGSASASASPGTAGAGTASDVTITSK